MDLAALLSYLRDSGDPLTLAATDQHLPAPLQEFLTSVPGQSLTISPGAAGLHLDGTVLTISGTATATWPAGLGEAAITLATAQVLCTSADAVSGTVTGTMPLSGTVTAPVSVTSDPPVTAIGGATARGWTVGVTADVTGVTPVDLITLGQPGETSPVPDPPGLSVLGQQLAVLPGGLGVTFYPGTSYGTLLTFEISAPAVAWTIIEGLLSIDSIALAGTIGANSWSVAVTGQLTVGGTAMKLTVGLTDDEIWTASVAPAVGVAFPGLAALAAWVGGSSLAASSSQGLDSIKASQSALDAAISSVSASFDWSAGTLQQVQVITLLSIGTLQLDVGVQYPQLTITGGLHGGTPVPVAGVLQSLDLPSGWVPQGMQVTQADFAADLTAGTYRAALAVDANLTAGPLTIEQVAVSINYTAADGITGQLGGTLLLGSSVLIDLLAAYGGAQAGWEFSGSTDPGVQLEIGELLTELAGSFGATAVPEPVRQLTLSDVRLSYQTGTGAFSFACSGSLPIAGTDVSATITINVKPGTPADGDQGGADQGGSDQGGAGQGGAGGTGYTTTFTGQLTLAGLQFDVVFDAEATGTDVLIADCLNSTAGPVELQALVASVSTDLARAIPPGISIDPQEIKFVFLQQDAAQWAFGLRLGIKPINLSELPVVGSHLPADQTLGINNLQILYSSADLNADQTKLINGLLPAGVAKLPDTMGTGISFDADVLLGTEVKHLHAGVTPPDAATAAATAAAAPAALAAPGGAEPAVLEGRVIPAAAAAGGAVVPASSTDPITWLDVNKTFGIFSFERVGAGYQDNVLAFALDASVSLGPLAFSMQALTVSSPLTSFEPAFSLKGLALSFNQPPLSIGGAFLNEDDAYYGELSVQAAMFGLKALGGWAPNRDPAFFFIYLSISAPLGGTPFLFVTGLSGGFGINSRLVLPTIDEVGSYILLPGIAPKEEATAAATISAVLPALRKTMPPQTGQYWVAAGISFTSFEMIESRAVVSVTFGVDLQIGVVGTCSMTLPTGASTPVAYVEIDVVASFTPSTGLLAIDGKLSPASYLFGGFVKLSGGFAFYAWFSGEHQGDFVVSLGGYHPAFSRPPNYPAVPRLEIAFSLGPLKVTGQSYFALTPSMLMAGIRLTATFDASAIKAWFDAGVDFLIAWAPFRYLADAWVTIGVSVDLGLFTLTLQIGAQLHIWGPDFGGQAIVDLGIISFTIAFGADRPTPAPIGWDAFATNFLPPAEPAAQPAAAAAHALAAAARTAAPRAAAPQAAAPAPAPVPNILQANVAAGLLTQDPAVDWVLDPDHFRILTSSTIPANHGRWATSASAIAELPNAVGDYQRALAPDPADSPAPGDPAAAGAAPAGTAAVGTAPEDAAPVPVPPPADMLLQLDYDAVTYSDQDVWAPTLNIAPMAESNVDSYHVITLRRRDDDGNLTGYVTGVAVTPQLTASNTALWGDPGEPGDVNAQRLISATLTGIAISPIQRHPGQVSDVPLLALIFGEGNSTGFGYQAPVVDQEYTVSGTVSADGETFTVDVGGGHTAALENQGYVLSALTDPWVSGQRTATLDELRQLGFGTTAGAAVSLTAMASTALTDWPSAARIGSETWA